MRKNRFLILSLAVLVMIISGAIQKHTVLKDARCDVMWPYPVVYQVSVENVSRQIEDMFFEGMVLYLEDGVLAGTVSEVERYPAETDAENCVDLTLHVRATPAGETSENRAYGEINDDTEVQFFNRFITFTGRITDIKGV